jgi:hypothetical protein
LWKCQTANVAKIQREILFYLLPCTGINTNGNFQWWKFTFVYHNSGINTLVGVPILQTYSKKITFAYHNSGINTFVGASTLLGAAKVAKCKHTFVYHNFGIYTFVGLPMLQSYSDRYLFLCTTMSLYQHCWKLPFLKGRQ